jgi:hypothetical protein
MTVQHVHVAEGGQAIVGNVSTPAQGEGCAEKMENNPVHWPMHLASRCRAISKRSGKPCQAPAVRGHEVCRMHGVRGGAPKGNRNALKHGLYTADAIEMRSMFAALAKKARELAEMV